MPASPTRALLLLTALSGITPAAARGQSPAPADPGAAAVAAPKLTVVSGGAATAGDGGSRFDAGVIDPAATPTVERVFTLKNETGRPITVSRLRASCGCTSLILTSAGTAGAGATLQPSQQAQVRMAVRAQGQPPGAHQKYAWAYGPDGATLATLEVDLTIREAVSFSPAVLNFGTVASGVEHSLPLTVTADTATLTGAALPVPTSSDPAIRITTDGVPQRTQRDGRAALRQNFRVLLTAQAPVGAVSGSLTLRCPPSASQSASVAVLGQVTGRLTAIPRTLFFGSVPPGRDVTRQVILRAPASEKALGLTAASGSRWLDARIPPSAAAPPGMRLLTVTLRADAPGGPLQADVTVTDAEGERLVLPVVADVDETAGHPREAR